MRLRLKILLPVLSSLPFTLGGCSGDDTAPASDGGVEAGADAAVEAARGDSSTADTSVPQVDTGVVDAITADTSTSPESAADSAVPGSDAADAGDAAEAAPLDAGDAGDAARVDAGDAARPDADASAELTFIRFAALSPDSTAVDFCLQQRVPAGGDSPPWMGPLGRANGLTSGLSYPQVSGYIAVPADSYDVRAVGAGATDCLTAFDGSSRYSGLPRLNPGEYTSIVFSGTLGQDGGPGLDMQGYRDDHEAAPGQAELRIIHASPGTPNVDVGLSTGESFSPLTTYLSYLAFSRGADFDFNGYLLTAPISNQTLSVKSSTDRTDVLTIPGFALPAGSVRTAFAIGIQGSSSAPVQVLVCDDLSTGAATSCTRLP